MNTKLKHLMLCMAVMFFSTAFMACNKDDDNNGPAFSKDGKRLVSKIVIVSENDSDEESEMFFSYNGDGEITAIEIKETYISEDDGKKYTDVERYTYSVSDRVLTVVDRYEDAEFPEESATYGGTFNLNADGLVESGKETDSDEDKFVYTCHYNADRYLTKMEYTRNGGKKEFIDYAWKDGDIINGWQHDTYTYYDDINKANIDFAEFDGFMLGYDRSYLGLVGYLGKINKHLLKKGYDGNYTYKFDQDGYVTEFSVVDSDATYNYQVNYN